MPGRNEQQLLGNAIVNSQFLSRLRDHCARHDGAKNLSSHSSFQKSINWAFTLAVASHLPNQPGRAGRSTCAGWARFRGLRAQ